MSSATFLEIKVSVFTEISIVTDGEAAEAVADVLRPYAYQNSVVLEQLGDPHDLDPLALQDEVTVKIFIPEEEDTADLRLKIEQILYHLNRLYPVPAPNFKKIPETDWANAWKENFHPFRVGERIWIIPSWTEPKNFSQLFRKNIELTPLNCCLIRGWRLAPELIRQRKNV